MTDSYRSLSDEELGKLYVKNYNHLIEDELLDRYLDRIFAIVKRIVKNNNHTEEVVREIFLSVTQQRIPLSRDINFTVSIFRLSVDSALKKVKEVRDHENSQTSVKTSWESTGLRNHDRILNETEKPELIEQVIDQLPESNRIIIHLRDIEGFSYKEIADILNITPGAVTSRLHRSRMVLRKKLSDFNH